MARNHSHGFDPNASIEAEILLPEELEQLSAEGRTGEFSLLWAVFADGIQNYCREILRGSMGSLAYREVERWIFRPSSDAITSFSSLAELFGVDPRRLRRALLRFRECPNPKLLARLLQRRRSLAGRRFPTVGEEASALEGASSPMGARQAGDRFA